MTFILALIVVGIDNLLGRKQITGKLNILGGNITQDEYPFWHDRKTDA